MTRPIRLSQRQEQVLHLAIAGLSNQQIATGLGLALGTVKDHMSAAYIKLGASNRAHAATIVLREQMARSPSTLAEARSRDQGDRPTTRLPT
jgi:DNA-binding NarL/FixJ family response regulator